MKKNLINVLNYHGKEYPVGTQVVINKISLNNSCYSGKIAEVTLPDGVFAKICMSFIEKVE